MEENRLDEQSSVKDIQSKRTSAKVQLAVHCVVTHYYVLSCQQCCLIVFHTCRSINCWSS